MVYYFMTEGKLMETIHMSSLDRISLLIAAACHDLGHDGMKNEYHVNLITDRAVDSNDLSIQEHFHAANAFKILSLNDCNFLD